MILYHGSEKIIDAPEFGKGNSHNDYGRGFYCTENEELAKEWACSNNNNGFANKYEFDMEQKEKEIYDLKHDLISDQIKIENLEEKIKTLEADKQELLVHKSKLEASLEDALLGGIQD